MPNLLILPCTVFHPRQQTQSTSPRRRLFSNGVNPPQRPTAEVRSNDEEQSAASSSEQQEGGTARGLEEDAITTTTRTASEQQEESVRELDEDAITTRTETKEEQEHNLQEEGRKEEGLHRMISEKHGPFSSIIRPNSAVYIGNLFFDVSSRDLRDRMSRYGNVLWSRIVYDTRGISKG